MRIHYFFFMFLFIGCANENDPSNEALPNTPESVVRAYQAFLDKNEFDKAKRLSTKVEKERLDAIFTIISTEPRDSTIFNTVFLEINCNTDNDKALCACLVEDFEEKYRDTFHLVKLRGQWLIDATEEVFNIESDIMFDDFINDMMNEPSNEND